MASPHNIKAGMQRAGRADVAKVADPGDGNSINPGVYDRAYCVVEGGSTRSLVSADRFPLYQSLLVISQTSTITVNSTEALADGEHAEFIVTLDSAGAKQWVNRANSDIDAEVSALTAQFFGAKNVYLPLNNFVVWDTGASLPNGAGSNDDLGYNDGTYGTDALVLDGTTSDAVTTQYARCQVAVPSDYTTGDALTLILNCSEVTASTDGATVDANVYRGAAPATDICATAAQDITSAAAADFSFTITPTAVVPGEILDIRVALIMDDTTTGTGTGCNFTINSARLSYTAA